MKNKLILLSIFLFFIINLEKVFSEEFKFEAIEIQIKDNGNILHAKDGVNITSNNGVEIISDSFEYNKKKQILFIEGNVKIFNKKNDLKIFGERFVYEKNIEKIYSNLDIEAILKTNII